MDEWTPPEDRTPHGPQAGWALLGAGLVVLGTPGAGAVAAGLALRLLYTGDRAVWGAIAMELGVPLALPTVAGAFVLFSVRMAGAGAPRRHLLAVRLVAGGVLVLMAMRLATALFAAF